ncbi:MAG: hypothetical protein EI684_13365 [Candidatus Viridilinea halotolerans]|uniref:Uncharacterized protein n=1 Tax=Candidatus Viridilinea halotolerans TaxID=2491704 RepID=A0A426TXH7_9CHLR|nr:MAG: hypothetical protein EI684_13365 [Candidatus Viridilinea halotolerans]
MLPYFAPQLKGIMVVSKDIPAKRIQGNEAAPQEDVLQLTFLEWLAPRWGRRATFHVKGLIRHSRSPLMTSFCGAMAFVVFLIGVGLLFGDGYATIQGVRYTLRLLGVPVRVDDFPATPWWTIQLILIFIQVFAKKISGLGVLWTPAYIFNATTTSVFIGVALGRLFGVTFGMSETLLFQTAMCAGVGALLGHYLALGAEQVTLTGLCMLSVVLAERFARK